MLIALVCTCINNVQLLMYYLHFVLQHLGQDLRGIASDYQAVPGRGLRCHVTDIESYADGEVIDNEEVFSREDSMESRLGWTSDIALDDAAQSYSVSDFSILYSFIYLLCCCHDNCRC